MAKKDRKSAGKKAAKSSSRSAGKRKSSSASAGKARKSSKAASKGKTAKKSAKKKSTRRKTSARKKTKTPLTAAQLREFRKILLEKRKELIGDMFGIEADALGKLRKEDAETFNMPTHPADIGTDNFEQEFTLGLLESERVLLGEINEALERIDDKTYGVCLGTGKPISLPRLRARPWSRYCIEYQRMLEQGLVHPDQEEDEDDEDFEDDEEESVDEEEAESEEEADGEADESDEDEDDEY